MTELSLSGDFYFNGRNIRSSDGFSFVLHLIVPGVDQAKHEALRASLQERLGLRAHEMPTPWGERPVDYTAFGFQTEDPSLCKHYIGLLKKAGEDEVPLRAQGQRYPPDTDHPLFPSLAAPKAELGVPKSFAELRALLDQAVAEAFQASRPVVGAKPSDEARRTGLKM
jgi:hypothetical protein